jgi:hypothetical protein
VQKDAKIELANAILRTSELRETTWNGNRYTLSYWDCVKQLNIDPDLQPLVAAMLGCGFADFPEWAEKNKQ